MRMITKFFGIAAALVALTAGAHAQTAVFVGAGSSALFLQLGQAAGTAVGSGGVGATCVWSRSSGNTDSLKVTDTAIETGNAWIAWNPGTTGDNTTCSTINSRTLIYTYVQADSVIGNRLYFNGGTLGYVTTSPSGSASGNLIFSSEQTLPAAVWNVLSGKALTAAGTDIRPEDAKFATLRANTDCGTAVQDASGNNTQYLGLGYTFGTSLTSYYNSSNTFHVLDFTLPTSGYTVTSIGAVPVVFAVNPSNTTNGFGTGVSNVLPVTLANFLNGTYGSTSDLTGAAGTSPATVLIREPLSGTYNTAEYTIPNTVGLQTSQDGGNCNGTLANTNPLHIASSDNANGYRNRVIGTGEAVKELLALPDSLGYSFWSTANFKNATSTTARYLTVNGYDPLYDSSAAGYSTIKNTIPTATNGYLGNVTFTDLNNGNYPAWSVLRLVSATSGTGYTYAHKLAVAAQSFVSTTSRPDFVPATSLAVWRSHFVPPSVTFSSTNTPYNGSPNGGSCGTEAGGDVGGVILTSGTCTTGERQ